ncbi:FAD-binding oxidoreductase [Variovorax sp. CY25R-8]|nr:FAD-binding oxidoreductase [Variovorax sp. CY25R-8]MCT8179204.1 FAD-binding oxidoreductase [Variovorax sp. CY25R-8]
MNPVDLIAHLRSVLGPTQVLSADLAVHEADWRGICRGRALAVARPDTTAGVAATLAACAAAGVSVVTQGGNTGLVGGAVPDDSGTQLVLSTARLNRVRELDRHNQTLTVEAGCILQSVQESAAAAGFLFPLSLAAEGSCTIGGNLASNAGGTQVLRYGNARDLCLGLEVVTPDGRVWEGLSGLRKDNTGYDLRNLYIGSEGTLGIITAATLKLFPRPVAQSTAWVAVPSAAAALELLALARERLGASLSGFELMGSEALALVALHFPAFKAPFSGDTPWCVLIEQSAEGSQAQARALFDQLLEQALVLEVITDAVIAESIDQSNRLWHARESIPLAQAREGANLKHDISVPISRIPAFLEATDRALRDALPAIRLITLGHVGDGNLHYNIQGPPGASAFDEAQAALISRVVYDGVAAHGGSISAEHGIGQSKLRELRRTKSPVALALMRDIKRALDPRNLLNPGRLLEPD